MKILYLVTFRIWISHVLCLNSKYKAHARPSTHQIYRDSMTQPWLRWPTNPISILVLWHLILKVCLRSLFGLVTTWLWFSFDLSSGIAADFICFDSIEGIIIEFHYFSEIAWNGWTIYFSEIAWNGWTIYLLFNRFNCHQVFLFPWFHRCLICLFCWFAGFVSIHSIS